MKEHPVKRTVAFIGSMVLIAALAGSPVAVAQDEQPRPLVPLKVQLVVSRHAADKKISSLPYTLWVTANGKKTTSVRMGVQVPVADDRRSSKEGGDVAVVFAIAMSARTSTAMRTSQADGSSVSKSKLNDSSVEFRSEGIRTRHSRGYRRSGISRPTSASC